MAAITKASFFKILTDKFPHVPTAKQSGALLLLAEFLLSTEKDQIYLVEGIRGNGQDDHCGDASSRTFGTLN